MLDISPYVGHNALVRWLSGLLDLPRAMGSPMSGYAMFIHAMRLRASNRDDYERVMRWHER